jgi:SNF2 family DNA or RNA helicase
MRLFFLDIIQIAFKKMSDPVPIYHCDCHLDPVERDLVLEEFVAAGERPRILLTSRGTVSQGLNIQCANVLIQCRPWWKTSWEEPAIGRLHRPGQVNPVFHCEMSAVGIALEDRKKRVRSKKNKTDQKILEAIPKTDDI